MFSDSILYGATHVIYALELADALERRGGSFDGGVCLCDVVDRLSPAKHEPIIRPILGNIERTLGVPLDKIFVAGGIVDEHNQEDALSDLLMGVLTERGPSIDDNYSEAWERGCRGCGVTKLLPCQ